MDRFVLLGPPASGKGTQAAKLSEHFSIPAVSTGAILREEIEKESSLGVTAEHHLARGELVPDLLMDELIASWVKAHGDQFIFDGYPRTKPQAESLDQFLDEQSLSLNCVITLAVPDQVLRDRVIGRLSCGQCNHVFQANSERGIQVDGRCPDCGSGRLYQRKDDNLETFELRLEEYARKTEAVPNYYSRTGRLQTINGEGTPEEVFARILKQLS